MLAVEVSHFKQPLKAKKYSIKDENKSQPFNNSYKHLPFNGSLFNGE